MNKLISIFINTPPFFGETYSAFVDSAQPYFKYILFLIWIVGFIWVNRVFINDPLLRKWLIASLEEKAGTGASGKSLTAFLFAQIIALASLVSIVYAPDHIMPEFIFISLLTFIASVYGIKLAGKFVDSKNSDTSSSTSTITTVVEDKKTSNVKKEELPVENKNVDPKDEPII